jgi:hypothetical protein
MFVSRVDGQKGCLSDGLMDSGVLAYGLTDRRDVCQKGCDGQKGCLSDGLTDRRDGCQTG